jgi:26S proteasome regulatory subunit (ATPase 3-interacting protein)
MDEAITSLQTTNPALKSTLKVSMSKLQTLESAPGVGALKAMIQNVQKENAEKAKKLNALNNGEVKQVSREEIETVEKEFKYWASKRLIRRNAFQGLEEVLREAMSKEEIWEKAGIEGEEK